MIEIKNEAFPSIDQWKIVIHGMRNPYNSWDKSDSKNCLYMDDCFFPDSEECKSGQCLYTDFELGKLELGKKDKNLAKNLINSGVEHAKFLRQLPIILDIKAPLYWWKQCDQYKIGTVTDSCSTMHKLTDKEFELSDFSTDEMDSFSHDDFEWGDVIPSLNPTIHDLNEFRDKYLKTKDKRYWYAINELLPQSYNQMRTWSANYAVLFNICAQRAGHPLKEWNTFIEWILENVPRFKGLCLDKLMQVKNFRDWYEEKAETM